MKYQRWIAAILALTILACWGIAKKKKKNEEPATQTLPVLQDPPPAIATDVQQLVFRVAPLSSKGLLSQQVRDALKALISGAHGSTIVKLRAFVAGTGDLRRVQTLVSETFGEKHLAVPALSTIQGGALPGEGVQVAIEAIEAQKKPANPAGLGFISGQPGANIDESIARIRTALKSQSLADSSVQQATCFLSSLDNHAAIRQALATAFPQAALDIVQMQRLPVRTAIECEAIATLDRAPAARVEFVNPEGLPKSTNYAQIALVGPGKVAISGMQLGFGAAEKDVRLAFERLGRALESVQMSYKDVIFAHIYPVSDDVTERIRAVRFGFFDAARPPASTMLPFEAMQSLDASFGMDVVAAK